MVAKGQRSLPPGTGAMALAKKVIALIAKGQYRIENVTAAICGGLVIALMIITAINVLGRKLFSHPLDGGVELSSLLLFALFIIPLGYVYRVGGHIGIEFIAERASPRGRAIMELITVVLMLPLMGFLTWKSVSVMTLKWDDVTSGLVKIPLWPFLVFLPPGFAFLGLRILRRMFETIAEIRGSKPPEAKEEVVESPRVEA